MGLGTTIFLMFAVALGLAVVGYSLLIATVSCQQSARQRPDAVAAGVTADRHRCRAGSRSYRLDDGGRACLPGAGEGAVALLGMGLHPVVSSA